MKRSKIIGMYLIQRHVLCRGRLANGEWIPKFDAQYPYYEYMYREANAWQLSFYVPHDMPGLVQLYGGAKPFEAKTGFLLHASLESHTSRAMSRRWWDNIVTAINPITKHLSLITSLASQEVPEDA